MAPKSKEKKEKGKKGKHKPEKMRLESTVEVLAPPIATASLPATAQKTIAPTTTAPAAAKSSKPDVEPATSTTDAILDAVIECVANGGIEGLTTRRIAAQAGVNEVTLFRRFGNKEALLDAVLAREATRMSSGALQYSSNLEADLARIVTHFGDQWVRRASVLPILIEVSQRRGAGQSTASDSFAPFAEFSALLERYMREGKLHREPVQQTLSALLGPLVLDALLARTNGKSAPLDTNAHVSAFLHGRAAA